jgi:hypothetical protein
MSNTAALTQTGQQVSELNAEGYLSGVAAHSGGDWAAHSTVRVHATSFQDADEHTVTGHTLRILATYDNGGVATNAVLALPVTASLSAPGGVGAAPFIAVQPRSATAVQGATVALSVVAVSTENTTFQWQKEDQGTWDVVVGGTFSVLIFASIALGDAGSYRCLISNAYGTTTSATATVTVVTT